MRFTTSAAHLRDALDVAAAHVATGNAFPLLRHVHLGAEDGAVTVLADDGSEVRAGSSLPALVEERGTACVSPGPLQALLKRPAAETVEVSDALVTRVTARCGDARVSVPVVPSDDFPQGADFSAPLLDATLPGSVLFDALERGSWAAADIESTAFKTAVRVAISAGTLRVWSADSSRGAMVAVPVDGRFEGEVLVAARALRKILPKLRGSITARVAVSNNGGVALFDTEGGSWMARTVDAAYPDLTRFLQQDDPSARATVDRTALLQALDAVKPVADLDFGYVWLLPKDGAVAVHAFTSEEEAEVLVPATLSPSWSRNAVLLRSAQAALRALPEGDVRICSTKMRPMLFDAGDQDAATMIVMPRATR